MHLIFIHRILLFLGLAIVAPLGATFLRQRATHLRVDPSGPKGTSSSDVPLLPLLQVLMLLRRLVLLLLMLMFLHRLLRMIQTFDVRWILSRPFRQLKDRFWWTFLMRFVVYEWIWYGFDVLHRHLLLMVDFDCPLAFHRGSTYFLEHFALCFCFQGESIFVGWSLWSLDCI